MAEGCQGCGVSHGAAFGMLCLGQDQGPRSKGMRCVTPYCSDDVADTYAYAYAILASVRSSAMCAADAHLLELMLVTRPQEGAAAMHADQAAEQSKAGRKDGCCSATTEVTNKELACTALRVQACSKGRGIVNLANKDHLAE